MIFIFSTQPKKPIRNQWVEGFVNEKDFYVKNDEIFLIKDGKVNTIKNNSLIECELPKELIND